MNLVPGAGDPSPLNRWRDVVFIERRSPIIEEDLL
jgi:hypothetical protein